MVALAGSTLGIVVEPEAAAGDRELKFSLPAARVAVARRWLETLCRPDPEYPRALVSTLYYDTPDLRSLGEKLDGDYFKLKVRLRSYADLDGTPSGPAFVEAKLKEGSRRTKIRVRTSAPPLVESDDDLRDPRLESLPLMLRPHGIVVGSAWRPVLLLRYRRDRFVEPVSRARIGLDSGIVAVAVNRRVVPTFDGTPLGTGVLEVKGDAERLPVALRSLLRLGIRPAAFSKYAAVYRRMTHSRS